MIYDITRTITPTTHVWPGDTPFSYTQQMSIAEGASVNLTTLNLSAHTGTHADAYWHYEAKGSHPVALNLDAYLGPARVISVGRESGGIVPEDLAGADLSTVQRVLLHTWVSDIPDDQWPTGFPYPTPALIDYLAERGIMLLGVDSPSMDPQESTTLDCHHRLYAHGMLNLESLLLKGVPDGVYELIALPLKLDEVCGSPVRAILRSL